jgi:hypothetical protein
MKKILKPDVFPYVVRLGIPRSVRGKMSGINPRGITLAMDLTIKQGGRSIRNAVHMMQPDYNNDANRGHR